MTYTVLQRSVKDGHGDPNESEGSIVRKIGSSHSDRVRLCGGAASRGCDAGCYRVVWFRPLVGLHGSTRQVVACGSKNEHSFQIFYGNAHRGPGNPDAVAILTYQPDPTGNGMGSIAAYFRQTDSGYTFVRRLPGYNGISAAPARFGGARVVLTFIYYKDGDPHCCPTGRRQVSLMLE